MTYQHVLILSSQPRADGKPYPERPPLLEEVRDVEVPTVVATVEGEGEGVVEVSWELFLCYFLIFDIGGWGRKRRCGRMMREYKADGSKQTYTVEFNRDGTPLRGYIVGRLKSNGARFVANHGDEGTLRELGSGTREHVGQSGWVRSEAGTGRNLFSFGTEKRVRL